LSRREDLFDPIQGVVGQKFAQSLTEVLIGQEWAEVTGFKGSVTAESGASIYNGIWMPQAGLICTCRISFRKIRISHGERKQTFSIKTSTSIATLCHYFNISYCSFVYLTFLQNFRYVTETI
jgi:hypothetical protein